MSLYEHIYLIRGDLSVNQINELTANATKIVESYGGKVTKNEYWGLRNLAYKIKKNKRAHYCLLNLDVPFDGLKELQRVQSVNENILRTLSVKVEVLDNKPSYLMKQAQSSSSFHNATNNTIDTVKE